MGQIAAVIAVIIVLAGWAGFWYLGYINRRSR